MSINQNNEFDEDMNNGNSNKQLLTINVFNKVLIYREFYEQVKIHVQSNICYRNRLPYLVPEDLLGINIWHEYSDEQKHMARICLAHLSQTGALPIMALDFDMKYPEYYVLKERRNLVN
jgi:hypothetical protein